MPNKPPFLPPEAEEEIMDFLFTNMRISSGEIGRASCRERV